MKNRNRKSRALPPEIRAARRFERAERHLSDLERSIASRGGVASLSGIREDRIQWRTVSLALERGRVVRTAPGTYAVPGA